MSVQEVAVVGFCCLIAGYVVGQVIAFPAGRMVQRKVRDTYVMDLLRERVHASWLQFMRSGDEADQQSYLRLKRRLEEAQNHGCGSRLDREC